MPLTGNKRRNSSEATCDSSHCAFCLQRAQSGTAFFSQHEHDSSSNRPSNEFESWLQHQTSSAAAHEHISLDKIGLPSSQLDSPPSKRNRPSLDFEEASSSDSSDPNNCTLQPASDPRLSAEHMIRHSEGTPWEWLSEWAERPLPMPAGFSEVCSFQQLSCQPRPAQHTADIVCGVEFSPDGHLLASAGVAKQVRLYSLAGQLHSLDAPFCDQPIFVQRLPSKLSSLAWDHNQHGVVTVGDYDGVVSQMHLESGHFIADIDDHGGSRVWSVRHSKAQAGLGMSTSDDGTARIWSGCGPHTPVAVIKPSTTASICDGAFCDYDRNLVGLASANHNAYVYDMRRLDQPLHVLTGHSRAVSYVRFLSSQRLVTASVDGSLACWDLPFQTEDAGDQVVPDWDGNFSGTAYLRKADQAQSWRKFRGHHNSKNFVGLTVRPEDGLMATGSETSTVFAYNTHWTMPLAQQDLAASVSSQWMDPLPDLPDEGEFSSALPLPVRQKQFVSAVNFMPRACQANLPFEGGPILAAAMSTGAVKLLTLNLLEEQKPSLSQNSGVQD